MSIDQLKLEVVPKEFLGIPMIQVFPRAQLQEGLDPWKATKPPTEACLNALRALLPIARPWGEVEEFASKEGFASELRIWWEEGQLENICFAYSPVADPWSTLQGFLSIVDAEDLYLVELDSGTVLKPTEKALLPVFQASRAARFMANPLETTLRSAADQKARRENV